MESAFRIVEGEGLYYEEKFVSKIYPQIQKVILRINSLTGKGTEEYLVALKDFEGKNIGEASVSDFHKLSYFDLWKYPDAMLPKQVRKMHMLKMQIESVAMEPSVVYECRAGLQMVDEKPVLIWGDEVYAKEAVTVNVEYRKIFQIRRMRGISLSKVTAHILQEISNYIHFWPGVSEMIFYGSLYAVLKPYLHIQGIKSGFLLFLTGSSGHLKTTMAQLYGLWLLSSEL